MLFAIDETVFLPRIRREGEGLIMGGKRDKSPDHPGPNETVPGERSGAQSGTVRQRIIRLLEQEELTARDISQTLGIREKEVYDHLTHISRTMSGRGRRLRVPPFACLACGYIFRERERFTRPGRCPRCKGTRIQTPVYRLS
jgi:hypothetical protein